MYIPGGYLTKCSVDGFSIRKKRTQSDVRFCENEGSNIFKINEKGGQLDQKLGGKLIQKSQNA